MTKEKFFTFEAVGAYKNLSLLHYVMVSFLCTIILYLFVYMGLLLRKELDNGIYSRLYGAGVFVWLYILEKIIVFTGLIVLPVLVLAMIGRIFLSISISLNTLLSVVFIVLAGVTFVIFICALFRKTSDYLLTGNFMCLFFTIFGGGLIPIMYLPDELIKLAHFTPTYWMIKLILLAETNQNTSSFYYSIPILSLGTFLFYLLSLLVYKKEALTHG